MKHVLFTYYSNELSNQFLNNVKLLLSNSESQYSEIIVCSSVDVPVDVMRSLSQRIQVNRIYPDHNSRKIIDSAKPGSVFSANPFLLTALSYRGSIVTVFDPSLAVINSLPKVKEGHLFYKTHTGRISAKLFTLVNTEPVSNLLIRSLSTCDFTTITVTNLLTHLIGNSVPLSGSTIYSKTLIFSEPREADLIIEDRLLAIDVSTLGKNEVTIKGPKPSLKTD